MTPLMVAAGEGRVEVVRLLLGHPDAKMTINHTDPWGDTALSWACILGHGGVAKALLESKADPTIFNSSGWTPMDIAKEDHLAYNCAEGRRECVEALEVSPCILSPPPRVSAHGACWQEAERAYLLWKARQVADEQGSGAVAVLGLGEEGQQGEEKKEEEDDDAHKALVNFVVHGLKGDLFQDLMSLMP
jgi:hypothetical protein